MQTEPEPLELIDLAPPAADLLEEVLAGLRREPKSLPCKFFYDRAGSLLFERITGLSEYYPTRTETAIMREHAGAMAREIGSRALLIEYGSGSSTKTRALLDRLEDPAGYMPIDISRAHLEESARALKAAYPGLRVVAVCADYSSEIDLPDPGLGEAGRAVYFPGSTIGNFEPGEVVPFLSRMRAACREGGAALIGADLEKDRATLEAAYDDGEGVTAAFNKNALAHVNRALSADFDPDAFDHLALWNEAESRVEMHLVSRTDQTVHVGGEEIRFAAGERLHTENSYKFTLDGFADLARRAGFVPERVWTDERGWFSVHLLRASRG